MLALLTLPLIGALGLAVDYADASRVRADLLGAADSAALGSIANGSPAMKDAAAQPEDGPLPSGKKDAKNLFDGYLIGKPDIQIESLDIDVQRQSGALRSKIAFRARVPMTFMGVFGSSYTIVEGTSTASMPMAPFMDFYMLLDNSPSMGVGAASPDVAKMVANTSDKCAFACHDLSNANNYYNLAKKLGVQMRIDVVRQATQALTQTAKDERRYTNQYRMGVYTFGDAATAVGLTQVIAPTDDLDKVRTAASGIDLMSIPYQNYNNDQQTSFDDMLGDLNKKIDKPGDGQSTSKRQKIVFFVSDGVGDSYKPNKCTKITTSGRCQEPIDVRACEDLKKRGVTVAVLYTTYLPLPTNAWYNTWIKPFQDEIPSRMSQCASPGYYFEVGPDQGIADAMQTLFKKIVTNLRLTS